MACCIGIGAGPANGDGRVGMGVLVSASVRRAGFEVDMGGTRGRRGGLPNASTVPSGPSERTALLPLLRSAIIPLSAFLKGLATTSGRVGISTDTSMPTSSGGAGYAGMADIIRAVRSTIGRGSEVSEAIIRSSGTVRDSVNTVSCIAEVEVPMDGEGGVKVPGSKRVDVAHVDSSKAFAMGTSISMGTSPREACSLRRRV